MPALRTLIAFLVCLPITNAADFPAKLRTLAGAKLEGSLVKLSDKEVVLEVAGKQTATPLIEVLDIDVGGIITNLTGSYGMVELTDGSQFYCSQFTIKGQQVELKLVSGPDVKVPLAAVSSYVSEAEDAKAREEWQGLLAKRGNRDLLAVKDAAGKINGLPGAFGEADEKGETIAFETSTGLKRQINLSRVHALAFLRKQDPNAPEVLCKVHDVGRNLLQAATLTLGDNGFTVTTVSGAKVVYPRDMLARFDFSRGKLTYLSDLEPAKVTETSPLDRVDHYRRDKNLDDGPIRLLDKTYPKGLALHAYTELVYDIGGQYKEFRTTLGIDELVGGNSHVKVVIEGDGKELFNEEFKRKDKPKSVKLSVQNVKLLRIVVSSVDLLGLGDHVDLADAKVSK